MSIHPEFKAKYPDVAQIFESWKTNSWKDDFRKCEEILDFLRKQYIPLQKKMKRAFAKYIKNNEKRNKLKDRVDAFQKFGGFPLTF